MALWYDTVSVCTDIEIWVTYITQSTVTHFGENKRLHLESPEQNHYNNSFEISGSKRRSRFSDLFFGSGTKYLFGSFFVPVSAEHFLQGSAGHAKVPAEVPEDSRVLRVRLLWFPTSNRLETWLILSGTTQSRQ